MSKFLARVVGVLGSCVTLLASAQNAAPKILPIEQFTKYPEFETVKISPDGENIAVSVAAKGKAQLSIIRLQDGKVLGTLGNDKHEFGRFDWVSNTRIVYMLAEYFGDLKNPQFTGEMFAIDKDMKNQAMIYGYRAGNAKMGTGTILKVQQSSYGFPRIVSTLRNDDRQILISEQKWKEGTTTYLEDPDAKPGLFLLDVFTGEKKSAGGVPLGGAKVLVDHDDQPRFAVGLNEKSESVVTWKPNAKDPWKTFSLPGFKDGTMSPELFGEDNDTVFITAVAEKESYSGLYRVNLKNLAVEKVFSFPDAEIDGFVRDFAKRKIVGVVGYSDKPVYKWLDENDPAAKMYGTLQRTFPKLNVAVTSMSDDAKKAIVVTFSDTNPGDFYLYEAETKKATYLHAARSWIDPKQMRPKESFAIKARDGLQLHGYITRPAGEGPYPLVVYPHGGPILRDTADFDPDVQLLASRGYAVLQVNFRGSAGYGIQFEEAGYLEWGAKMQDDVTDATLWALEQKISSPGRVCIFGASYGGYAALMGAVREPKLYKCAIGEAGPYDLELKYSKGDTHKTRSGRDYLEMTVGTDKEQLRARSPAHNAQKIEIPILLIHGKEDWRVDFDNAKHMKAALEKNKKSFEWIALSREGHGVFDEDSKRAVYERILAFLDKHLMNGAKN